MSKIHGMAATETGLTQMMHVECDLCPMTGTFVVTDGALRAWTDHIDTHGPNATYRAWGWTIVPLFE